MSTLIPILLIGGAGLFVLTNDDIMSKFKNMFGGGGDTPAPDTPAPDTTTPAADTPAPATTPPISINVNEEPLPPQGPTVIYNTVIRDEYAGQRHCLGYRGVWGKYGRRWRCRYPDPYYGYRYIYYTGFPYGYGYPNYGAPLAIPPRKFYYDRNIAKYYYYDARTRGYFYYDPSNRQYYPHVPRIPPSVRPPGYIPPGPHPGPVIPPHPGPLPGPVPPHPIPPGPVTPPHPMPPGTGYPPHPSPPPSVPPGAQSHLSQEFAYRGYRSGHATRIGIH